MPQSWSQPHWRPTRLVYAARVISALAMDATVIVPPVCHGRVVGHDHGVHPRSRQARDGLPAQQATALAALPAPTPSRLAPGFLRARAR
jgi:hypothetical protein